MASGHWQNSDKFYQAWASMKRRCDNPKVAYYQHYGGRGIGYDSRWKLYKNFEADMKPTYQAHLTLDRIDNNKGYSKANCRWATLEQQMNNRRNSRYIRFRGIVKTLTQWARYFNLKRSTVSQRYYVYHWSIAQCLSQGE